MKFHFMTRYFFIVICAIGCCVRGHSQSLSKQQDSLQIPALLSSAVKARSTHLDTALLKAQKALVLSETYEWPFWQAKSHAILGGILSLKPAAKDIKLSNEHTLSALAMFREVGDSLRVQRCLINLSNNYMTLNEFPKAISFAKEALHLCLESHKASGASNTMKDVGLAYGTLARAYSGLQLLDSTTLNYKRAFEYLEKVNSPMRFITLSNLAEIQLSHNLLQEALDNFRRAYIGSKTENFSKITTSASLGIARVHFKRQEYIQSIELLQDVVKTSKQEKYWGEFLDAHYFLAQTYETLQQTDSTLYHLNQGLLAIDSLANLEQPLKLYKYYGEILERGNQPQKALSFFKKANVLSDSLEALKKIPETTSLLLSARDELATKRQHLIEKQLSSKNDLLGYILLVALLVCLLVIYLLVRNRKRLKREQRTKEQLSQRIEDEVHTKELNSRKLASAKANAALQNDTLKKVNELLHKIREQKNELPFKGELKKTHQEIQSLLAVDSLWEDFFRHFDQVHPQFLGTLKSKYHLTQHELRLCAFIKMNLSHKEIARILGVNHNTINVALFRLKKKLHLPKEVSTSDFLQEHPKPDTLN